MSGRLDTGFVAKADFGAARAVKKTLLLTTVLRGDSLLLRIGDSPGVAVIKKEPPPVCLLGEGCWLL